MLVFVGVSSIEAFPPVSTEINLHFRHVFEIVGFEEGVPGRGGFDIALHVQFVGEEGAPFEELSARAAVLVGGVGVDYIEHYISQPSSLEYCHCIAIVYANRWEGGEELPHSAGAIDLK